MDKTNLIIGIGAAAVGGLAGAAISEARNGISLKEAVIRYNAKQMSAGDFVTNFYRRILGREPDASFSGAVQYVIAHGAFDYAKTALANSAGEFGL